MTLATSRDSLISQPQKWTDYIRDSLMLLNSVERLNKHLQVTVCLIRMDDFPLLSIRTFTSPDFDDSARIMGEPSAAKRVPAFRNIKSIV